MRLPILMLVLLTLLCPAAFGQSTEHHVRLNNSNSGGAVAVPVGGSIDLVLWANPSTGYDWEVVSFDSTVIEQVGKPEFSPDSDMIGAPGKMTFHWRAIKAGSTDLKLVYHKPGENSSPPLKTFQTGITVIKQDT